MRHNVEKPKIIVNNDRFIGQIGIKVGLKSVKLQVIFIIFKFRLAIAWHAKTFLKPDGAADRHIRNDLCLRSINM